MGDVMKDVREGAGIPNFYRSWDSKSARRREYAASQPANLVAERGVALARLVVIVKKEKLDKELTRVSSLSTATFHVVTGRNSRMRRQNVDET